MTNTVIPLHITTDLMGRAYIDWNKLLREKSNPQDFFDRISTKDGIEELKNLYPQHREAVFKIVFTYKDLWEKLLAMLDFPDDKTIRWFELPLYAITGNRFGLSAEDLGLTSEIYAHLSR